MKIRPDQEASVLALLKDLPLFAGCSEAQLRQVMEKLEPQTFAKNKVVLMEQEISRTLYILSQGLVRIWRREGGEKKLLAELKAPNFFGESSMFLEAPANALVKAEEICQLLALPRSAFDDLAGKDPTFGLLIERNMDVLEEKRPAKGSKPKEGESKP